MQTQATSQQDELRLVPVSLRAVRAELAGGEDLGPLLRAEITPEWPPEDWDRPVLELLEQTLGRDPTKEMFQRYVLLPRPPQLPVLIGCVGGFLWPDRPDEVEIGYSILPAFRRRGYATCAAQQHVAWLCGRPERFDLVAQTFPHLQASLRILERLNFKPDGPGREQGAMGFRLRAQGKP